MAFDSEDIAYDMYNNYAGGIRFTIRKSTTRHLLDYVFLNTSHHLFYGIFNSLLLNILGMLFRSIIERSKIYFNKKRHDLLREYNLEDNVWMSNLNELRDE
jgi:hypothetical protein